MKFIVAAIPSNKVEAAKVELHKAEIEGMLILDCTGAGAVTKGRTLVFMGKKYKPDQILTKKIILVAVENDEVSAATAAIKTAVGSGEEAVGSIFLLPLEDIVNL